LKKIGQNIASTEENGRWDAGGREGKHGKKLRNTKITKNKEKERHTEINRGDTHTTTERRHKKE